MIFLKINGEKLTEMIAGSDGGNIMHLNYVRRRLTASGKEQYELQRSKSIFGRSFQIRKCAWLGEHKRTAASSGRSSERVKVHSHFRYQRKRIGFGLSFHDPVRRGLPYRTLHLSHAVFLPGAHSGGRGVHRKRVARLPRDGHCRRCRGHAESGPSQPHRL